jgi:hypothetical protein
LLVDEVQALLAKEAIYPVHAPLGEGFWSGFFLTPKKSGDWRLILNLKPLNAYIRPKRFRMETLASVLQCPIKGKWTTSLDLKDAYLHVPIRPEDQKWLRFELGEQVYQFRCLPFGLSTAPKVFTYIVRSVAAFLRRHGISVIMYLDDWLVVSPSKLQSQRNLQLSFGRSRASGS